MDGETEKGENTLKTKAILVRDVVHIAYPGEHSVKVTEDVEVEIIWPWDKEPHRHSYAIYGDWRVLRTKGERDD